MGKQKSMPWFRFYTDWRVNPKVRQLPAELQLRYIELLCLKREGFYPCNEESLKFHLRCNKNETKSVVSQLTAAGLLTKTGDIHHWNSRQPSSYSSTDRVREHRERVKQNETFQKRSRNVTETPQSRGEQNRQERARGGDKTATEISEYIVGIWNNHFNRKCTANKEVVSLVKRILKKNKGVTKDDIEAVVRHRISAKWVNPGEHSVVSLIRESTFIGHLETAQQKQQSFKLATKKPRL